MSANKIDSAVGTSNTPCTVSVVAHDPATESQTIASANSSTRSSTAARMMAQPVAALAADAMQRHETPVSPRSAPRTCSINRCARHQLLLVYLGIGAYIFALVCWWGYVRSDTLPLDSSNWLAVHGQRLIRSPGARSDGARGAAQHGVENAAAANVTTANKAAVNATAASTALLKPLKPKLECLGWRQTGGCDPNGTREAANDLACNKSVSGGSSGYCALRDVRTGEEVRAMLLTCSGLRRDKSFRCEEAVAFADFQANVQQLVDTPLEYKPLQLPDHSNINSSNGGTNGIVMVMYPKLLASVYASIRSLRSLNCSLPVELWYLKSEISATAITTNPILQTLQRDFGPVSLHAIAEAQITGFNSKVYAIAYTDLDNVLFLDADNIAVKDPTFLFETREFRRDGAVFWPDFWHPVNTIFNVHSESLLWELVGTPAVDMFEQESGQLLIDRRRSGVALRLLQLFAFHQPSLFDSLKLVHGDKDLFRLAWLRTNTSFHMVGRPPAAAGRVNAAGVFCGMTMAQYDPQEQDILFLHRNAKKLTGGTAADPKDPQVLIWTHLQTFDWDVHVTPAERYKRAKEHFTIAIYGGGGEFPETKMCYGERRESAGASGFFHTVAWESLGAPLRNLEPTLLQYAHDALALPPVVSSKTA